MVIALKKYHSEAYSGLRKTSWRELFFSKTGMKQTLGKRFFKSCKVSYTPFSLSTQFAKQYCGTLGKETGGNKENPKK